MNLKTKQHVCFEFCVWPEKMPKEMTALLKKAFGDKFLSNSNIKSGTRSLKMVKSQLMMHRDVVGQELG